MFSGFWGFCHGVHSWENRLSARHWQLRGVLRWVRCLRLNMTIISSPDSCGYQGSELEEGVEATKRTRYGVQEMSLVFFLA